MAKGNGHDPNYSGLTPEQEAEDERIIQEMRRKHLEEEERKRQEGNDK